MNTTKFGDVTVISPIAFGGGGGGESNVFVATYNVTTYGEVVAAYRAGKAILVNAIYGEYEFTAMLSGLDYTAPGADGMGFVFITDAFYKVDASDSGKGRLKIICNDEQDGWQVEEIPAAETPLSSTIPASGALPNVLYALGEVSGTLSILLASPGDVTIANPYHITFATGATAPTVTWDSHITKFVAGGSTEIDSTTHLPVIKASKSYEISVLDGTAIVMEV